MAEDTPKFRAFISYSRKDKKAVRKLYKRLTNYEIPKRLRRDNNQRLGRFFLDQAELGAAGSLNDELIEKLNESQRLIVCCSPGAKASEWVNAEVEAFLEHRGRDGLLAVILEGEPEECFPPALLREQPLAADFRPEGDGEEIGFLKLVAGFLYVDLGELRDLQAKAERARARVRAALTATFALLAAGASTAAVIAVRESERAQAMTLEAIDIGAGIVDQADDLSLRNGVPVSALEGLLDFADERFEILFAQGVSSPELSRQQAQLLVQISELYGRMGRTEDQREAAARAAAIINTDVPPQMRFTLDYVRANAALGDASWSLGEEAEAIAAHQEAIRAGREMLVDIPGAVLGRTHLAASLQRLGKVHMQAGRPAAALPLFSEAIPMLIYVADANEAPGVADANLASGLRWRGGAEALMGDYAAAETSYREALDVIDAALPGAPDSRPLLATRGTVLVGLGQVLNDTGRADEGRALLLESLAAAETAAAADPQDGEAREDVALRTGLIANLDLQAGRLEDAAAGFRAATVAWVELADLDPGNLPNQRTAATIVGGAAETLGQAGDVAGALEARRIAVGLARRPAEATGADEDWEDLAFALELQGDAAAQARDLETILASYSEAEPIRRGLAAAGDPEAQAAHASVLHALGQTRRFAGDPQGSAGALSEAADIRSALPGADAAFGAADSLQQAALAQAEFDGEATKASLLRARTLLRPLVEADPANAAYAASLARTEEILALFDEAE
ncbi:MAG: toll/interleukin-1 receptor domain-containing protein [Pseudomonadota bacterium]